MSNKTPKKQTKTNSSPYLRSGITCSYQVHADDQKARQETLHFNSDMASARAEIDDLDAVIDCLSDHMEGELSNANYKNMHSVLCEAFKVHGKQPDNKPYTSLLARFNIGTPKRQTRKKSPVQNTPGAPENS